MNVNALIQRRRAPRRAAWLLVPAMLALLAVIGARDVPLARAQAVGTVTVTKQLLNTSGQPTTGDLSGYVFTLTSGLTTITMPATNAQGQSTIGVAAGNYTITEQPRAGSTLVDFQIGGAPVGSFTVTAGGTVTITARNQVAGNATLTINKVIVDANGAVIANSDASGFQFAVVGPNGFSTTVTSDVDGSMTIGNLAAGNYTVTEQPRSGWTLVQMTINGVQVTNGQQFSISAGQGATVEARNRQGTSTGTVAISKQIVDASGNQVSGDRAGFLITVTCGSAFTQTVTTDPSGAASIANVPAGNCAVTEASRQGWTLVSIFSGTSTLDIGQGGIIQVVAGQTTAVVIRNRSTGASGTTEQIQLFTGCNNVTVTWPNGTPTTVVAQNVAPPPILIAIWRFDNARQAFVGFSPIPNAPNDLVSVDRAQPVFICTNGNGSLTRPVI
jgi:hypothetical protein